MWVAYFLDYSDRQAVFSVFPLLKSQLRFTNVELGLTGSLFLWVYGLCSPIAGQLADRFSKRVLVFLSLMLWSVVTLLTGLADSPAVLLSLRGLTGVTEALFMPAAISLTAYAHSQRTRSLAIGALMSAQLAGIVMGGWYGGFMGQVYSWRMAFLSLGMFGIGYGVIYGGFLKGVPEEITSRASGGKPVGGGLALRKLLKVPTYRYLCACFPVYTALLWLLYTWFPNFLYEKFSLSLADAGLVATLYIQSGTLVGLITGGVIADRIYVRLKAGRYWTLCAGMLFSAPWAIVIGQAKWLLYVKLAAFAFGLGSGVFMANLFVCAFDVAPPDTRASAVGFINLIGAPISGLGALMVGIWKGSVGIPSILTYSACLSVLGGLALVAGVKAHFPADWNRSHRSSDD